MQQARTMSSRDVQIDAWLRDVLGSRDFALQPASEDASFRRYLRVHFEGGTRILMDAPPDKEDSEPFVKVAALLSEAGVHAPAILAQDLGQGLLLLSDLGTRTYLDVLDPANADTLFEDALEALLRWQQATRAHVLPPYDEALLRRELMLFPQWYLERHIQIRLSDAERETLEGVFSLILERTLAQPKVFVHRDYMPRNLMLSAPNPGVIDFQDAVLGPVSYDVISLFKDAFVSWEAERVEHWTRRYWEKATACGLPVPVSFREFQDDLDWMGLQRHLKVLGIFARIHYRDGKPRYLADTPRFLGYVRDAAQRHTELTPLLHLLDRLQPEAPAAAAENGARHPCTP